MLKKNTRTASLARERLILKKITILCDTQSNKHANVLKDSTVSFLKSLLLPLVKKKFEKF